MKNKTHIALKALTAVTLTVGMSAPVYAAGTNAGTIVDNTFTLEYFVDGVQQAPLTNTATPTQFTVDRLVDLTVNSVADNDPVAPGAVEEELIFSLTNTGNDTQAYALQTIDETTDQFDPTAVTFTYYVDDGDGLYEPGAGDGAPITYNGINTVDLPPDRILWVRVTGDIPSDRVDTDTASVTLLADTLEPSTSANAGNEVLADTDTTNSILGAAENVLADGAGTTNEAANAGDHSDTGTYVVGAAAITASKTASVRSMDGTSCTDFTAVTFPTSQYSIPGSCMSYLISAENTGSVDATSVVLNDILPANFTFAAATSGGFDAGAFGNPALPAVNTDCAAGACEINFENGVIGAGDSAFIRIHAWIK